MDELVSAGIEPMVTLYHWDLPYELYKQGGWKNGAIPEWFGSYAKTIVETVSDRVKYWITFNEPQMFVGLSYNVGAMVPFGYAMGNAWWADPIYLGCFGEDTKQNFGDLLPQYTEREWEEIAQPLDFYGFNAYQGTVDFRMDKKEYDTYAYQGSPKTMLGWAVTPEVLYYAPKFLYERYGKPILITENGMAGMDWSIMDNMEWSRGYDYRFGLIHVDYQTQKRTLKDSSFWYSEVIKTNGGKLRFP